MTVFSPDICCCSARVDGLQPERGASCQPTDACLASLDALLAPGQTVCGTPSPAGYTVPGTTMPTYATYLHATPHWRRSHLLAPPSTYH